MKMYSESMPMGNAKKHNQGGMKSKGEMGQAGKVERIMPVANVSGPKPMKVGNKGYDKKAWEYKY